MSLTISKGIKQTAVRGCFYGVEGVGKSSLASLLPSPIFLDLEDGTHQLDVARAPVDTFAALQSALATLSTDAQGFRTVIIDSADWAERLCTETMLKRSGKKSIEDFGFGKGFVMLSEEMARTLELCDVLIRKGVHVIWIAHAKTQRVSPPDMVDGFDRYELKMSKQVAPLFKEWADLLLFANYEISIVKGNDGRVKGEGGKRRLIYTERSAAWDAKNRYGLPETLPMEAGKLPAELASIFAGKATPRITPPASAPVATAEDNAGSAPAPQTPPAVAGITPEQSAKLTTYAGNSIGAKVIAAALDHYVAVEVSELTEEQAAKVIARCQEEMNKAAEKPKADAAPKFPWPPSVAAWLAANEEKANAYFIEKKKWLKVGQTWKDLDGDHAETVVTRQEAFAKAAGIAMPAMKEAA